MKNVLVTGGTGFIGRNICPQIDKICNMFAPNRKELNLLDEREVYDYISYNNIQIVINLANPNPVKNTLDNADKMFEDSIRIFLNLYRAQDIYEKMYTFGSGAEYDKSLDIVQITEEEENRSLPHDSYGLAKYTINQIICNSPKQCNLRIFGCYGPTDHESKFITHAIRCCMNEEVITIRQDCYFDYMHVNDVAKVIEYFIYHNPKYHSYNVCSGTRILLSDIANIVRTQMNSKSKILLLKDGLNKEYTGSNKRLLSEIGKLEFTSIEDGIKLQIESEYKEA